MDGEVKTAGTPVSEGLLDLGGEGRGPGDRGASFVGCRVTEKGPEGGKLQMCHLARQSAVRGPAAAAPPGRLSADQKACAPSSSRSVGLGYLPERQDQTGLARPRLHSDAQSHCPGQDAGSDIQPGTLSSFSGLREVWMGPQLDLCSGSSPPWLLSGLVPRGSFLLPVPLPDERAPDTFPLSVHETLSLLLLEGPQGQGRRCCAVIKQGAP